MIYRLFVDMDGTLAVFNKVDTLEALYEQGYFLNLEPHLNVIRAVERIVRKHPEIGVHILSSVLEDSPYAVIEKSAWLDRYLPEIPHERRTFPPCGQNKRHYIRGPVTERDFLLDDYTRNLTLWGPLGRGIKLLNGINDTRGSWDGDRIRFDKSPHEIANNIVGIVVNRARLSDRRPQDDRHNNGR
ncbi:MAG: hypothetical protein DDT20_01724 [Firmicutes bacterium]|nr:hypothetical protein [Bacillota bacterium]